MRHRQSAMNTYSSNTNDGVFAVLAVDRISFHTFTCIHDCQVYPVKWTTKDYALSSHTIGIYHVIDRLIITVFARLYTNLMGHEIFVPIIACIVVATVATTKIPSGIQQSKKINIFLEILLCVTRLNHRRQRANLTVGRIGEGTGSI